MAYILRMPKLGLEMSEGILVEWLAEEGKSVEEGQPVAAIESEKSAAEVEAREDGVLRRTLIAEGEATEPGGAIGIVAGSDEAIDDLLAEAEGTGPAPGTTTEAPATVGTTDSASNGGGEAASVKASPRARRAAERNGIELAGIEGTGPGGAITEEDVEAAAGGSTREEVKATPRAKRRAEELGVSLTGIEGTGPQGAVSAGDVEAAAEREDAQADSAGGAAGGESARVEERELCGMRRSIADRLGTSYREAVHVTVNRSADATALLAATDVARTQLSESVSVTDVLLVCLSEALATHPELNGTFEDGVHRVHDEHNVCLAVDVEEGLVAPVLRGIESLSVVDLAEKRSRLTERTLNGEYTMDDLSGGSFTVSNLGVLGVESFDPIINPPQVAILGMNALDDRVVAEAGDPVVRPTLPLSLSFDHRVVDGADAARFLHTLVDHVEEPWPLLDGVERPEGERNVVTLPERMVRARLAPDLSGSVTGGALGWPFDVTERFGGGRAPTPVDHFLGALSACLSASIGVQAEMRDVTFDAIEVDVEGSPAEGSVESIEVSVSFAGCEADDETIDRIVEGGERTCHVAELLRDDLPVELSWERQG